MKRTTFFTILFALVTITGWAQNNFTISGGFSVLEKAFYTPTKVVSVHIYNDSTAHLPLGKRQEKCVVKDGKFKISGNVSRPIYSNLVAELEMEIEGEKRHSSTEIPFILEPGNIVLGTECLRIEAFAEPLFAASIVCNGIFVGAGDTLRPAIMSLASMWGVRLTLAALLASTYGLQGVWIAMAIELTFRGIIFLVRLSRFQKQ